MERKSLNLQGRLYLISALVFLCGLISAIAVYRTAEQDISESSGYEVIGGYIYPTSPENTKKYTHDLKLYGGTAAVLADEFTRWFRGLWRGTSLAFTVVGLTTALAFGLFLIAKYLLVSTQTDDKQ